MKKVFNYLLIVLMLGISLLGLQVDVEATQTQTKTTTKTSPSKPEYIKDPQKDQYWLFIANGTPITIIEKNGETFATWNGGEQKLNAGTTVIGGKHDGSTASTSQSKETIDYVSTSITMNGGKVDNIIGGNVIELNYGNYDKIHVGTINININGGEVSEVSGVSGTPGNAHIGVGPSADMYQSIKSYYYADKVNINISNSKITRRVYILAGYTYAKDAIVNVNNTTIHGGEIPGLHVGTNGKVDNFVANINGSKITNLSSGYRTMVENMTFNVTGNSTIGDIYAGSYYPKAEQSDEWTDLAYVDYGQVASMTFNLGDNVAYNNIYKGFQYLDKQKLLEKYKDTNGKLPLFAQGIDNSERANCLINIATSPLESVKGLESMLNSKESFVTVNIKKEAEVEVTNPNDKVEVPTIGVIDKENVQNILSEILSTNDKILEYIQNGIQVDIKVESKVEKNPTKQTEIVNKVKSLTKDAKIASFFEITINIFNKNNNLPLLTVSEINRQMNLSVILPDKLKEVAKGYKRTYYILREHNGQIEVLNSKLSTDGKYIAFSSDKFSTFALAYSDAPITVKNPNTFDGGIMNNLVIITASLLLAIGSAIYLRKELKKSK